MPEPTEVLVTRWKRDPFACGSYAYFPPADTTSPLDMVELSRPLFDGVPLSELGSLLMAHILSLGATTFRTSGLGW